MDINKLNLFELRIFRAVDEPELASEFFHGHQNLLSKHKITGLKSASGDWIKNPSVYLMAVISGKKIIAGSRLHLYNPDFEFPYEKVLIDRGDNCRLVIPNTKNDYHGEWCGLWISKKFSGLGLRDFLTRIAITTAHELGLKYVYGICPRHTLDPFRKIGFHFMTINDEVIEFSYPTPEFMSFVIRCETDELKYTFLSEKRIIREWLDDPKASFNLTGKLGECIVKLNGFPESNKTLLHREKVTGRIKLMRDADITRSIRRSAS